MEKLINKYVKIIIFNLLMSTPTDLLRIIADYANNEPQITFTGRENYDRGYYEIEPALEININTRFSHTQIVLLFGVYGGNNKIISFLDAVQCGYDHTIDIENDFDGYMKVVLNDNRLELYPSLDPNNEYYPSEKKIISINLNIQLRGRLIRALRDILRIWRRYRYQ